MTNNQLTDERVTSVIERLEHYACSLKWTNVRGAQDLLTAADGLRELQERRKPLQDKDLQGVIDALEHPAGINAAGKQVVRHALVEIQERRKAERDSNPVGWTDEAELRDVEKDGCGYLFKANPITPHADPRRVIPLYRHAQPASEREQVRQEHAEWSQATFGNVGPVGPLKHLSKEALEAAAEPGDLSEWAEQKDGEPRLHIKEQPAPVAPVVPDFKKLARELVDNLVDCGGLDEGVKEKYLEWAEKTCRAAMLVSAPQEAQVVPEKIEQSRKRVDRCDVCTEGARGGCGTCIFNGNFE
ncbi:dATP/dGTP pyrophosphohydrolase domain-containing protein [Klebsiella pneumoniae]|uniref:dATP/dGTP pyrophosphohydrolase domain-containing protein n=1 Tax=Klebsiella pneumoniae TaxID=573 RepID=UPI003AD278F1